jgi:hypothetical protein
MSLLTKENKKDYIQKKIDDHLLTIQKSVLEIYVLKKGKEYLILDNAMLGRNFSDKAYDDNINTLTNLVEKLKTEIKKMKMYCIENEIDLN